MDMIATAASDYAVEFEGMKTSIMATYFFPYI